MPRSTPTEVHPTNPNPEQRTWLRRARAYLLRMACLELLREAYDALKKLVLEE